MMNRNLNGISSIFKKKRTTDYTVPLILTILSAILLPLSLPNELFIYGLPILSFICLAPFFIAIIKAPTYRFTVVLGIIFGAISTYITYYWLQFFGNYTVFTIGGVTLGYCFYFALLTPFLRGLSRIHPPKRALIIAVGWAYYEFLKSSGFLAFPWALISHPMHDVLPMIQIVDITGVWGLSFLIALINAIIAEIIIDFPEISVKNFSPENILKKRWISQGMVTLALLILVLGYGTIRLLVPIKADKEVRVVLVQQNRDPWARGYDNYELSILQAEALTLAGLGWAGENKPDMVVWSETSFQSAFREDRISHTFDFFPEKEPFFPFLKKHQIPFLVGAPHYRDGDRKNPMNSVVLLSPDAEVLQYYGKQHPVPFVESIPFWEIPVVRSFYRNVIGIHGVWTTGNDPTVFTLPLKDGNTLAFSTPICFEDVFSDVCRKFILNGAEMLINLTNVSWSKTDSAEIQMFISAKFRAVENRRVLVRSTNSGVTSIVDAKGKVLAQLPLFTPDHLLADIPVMKEDSLTFYTMYGDYLPLIFGFFILGLCIANAILTSLYIKKLHNA
ncbi:MAG: apolipoprotein N-acyltransferase [Spirochaetales bacterium]|nr:apolipoprotein N-acyltransferase [Spirochaetales bacterium]